MKILVICQHYWPEPYPLADFCEACLRAWQMRDAQRAPYTTLAAQCRFSLEFLPFFYLNPSQLRNSLFSARCIGCSKK